MKVNLCDSTMADMVGKGPEKAHNTHLTALSRIRDRAISISSQDATGSTVTLPERWTQINDVNAESNDAMVKSPDGGWGWVVVAASFVGFILLSVPFSGFSVLYVALINHFQSERGVTGWIGSLYAFTGNILGRFPVRMKEKFPNQNLFQSTA